MPDTKITALTAIGANPIIPSTFPIPMVDLTDTSMAASGTTKKVTVNQILGAGGTATLASATITGDLTVDTSTLKVDSANNRVGINTASPIDALHVVGSARLGSTNFIGIGADASGSYVESTVGTHVLRFNTTGSERYRLDSTGVATWSNVGGVAGTAMTLNAAGLGVGATASSGGSISNTSYVLGGIFSTLNGALSVATATPTTLFAAPSESTLMVTAYVPGGSPSDYKVVAVVKRGGVSVAITTISSATSITITNSGTDIQVTQTSGGTQNVYFNVIRLA